MEILEQIKHVGLSDKESRVFLALLELGPSLASEVSKQSGVSRTFCYDVLNKLGVMGLVKVVSGTGSKRRYVTEHPRRLVTYLDNQKKKFENRKTSVEKLLPQLVSLYKTEHKPVVKFYEGIDGVKEVFRETLQQSEEILVCSDVEEWETSSFKSWMQQYFLERSQRKIKVRGLINPTKHSTDFIQTYPPQHVTEYRWLRSGVFPSLGCEVNIFGDKIIMAIVKQPVVAVLIDSEELSTVFRVLFETAWHTAEKIN